MEVEFTSQEELYMRVRPALKTKLTELEYLGYTDIQLVDIWSYLIKFKWLDSHNLTLYDIVCDILNVDGECICKYLKDNK